MKFIRYTEQQWEKMKAILDNMTVTGRRQAEYLLMLNQILNEGTETEEEEDKKDGSKQKQL